MYHTPSACAERQQGLSGSVAHTRQVDNTASGFVLLVGRPWSRLRAFLLFWPTQRVSWFDRETHVISLGPGYVFALARTQLCLSSRGVRCSLAAFSPDFSALRG
jgi:hypothetical protein